MGFQRPSNTLALDRKDHIWCRVEGKWVCGLCGAFVRMTPPDYPTPREWMPERFVALTDAERKQCE